MRVGEERVGHREWQGEEGEKGEESTDERGGREGRKVSSRRFVPPQVLSQS